MLQLESQSILEQKPEAGISNLRDSGCSSRFSGFFGDCQMKFCRKCEQTKPLSKFYKNHEHKDGHKSECKKCSDVYDKKYRKTERGKLALKRYEQSERYKESRKIYHQSKKGKENNRRNSRKQRILHPYRMKARNAVSCAVIAGRLFHPDTLRCHYCPVRAGQYHHHRGYAKKHWLDVQPVCQKCHAKLHRKVA